MSDQQGEEKNPSKKSVGQLAALTVTSDRYLFRRARAAESRVSTVIVVTFHLLDLPLLTTTSPRGAILDKLLHPRPQRRIMQLEIIHRTNTHDLLARKPGADAVHQRAADGAKVVFHGVARGDGAGLFEGGEFVGAAEVFD